LHLRLTHAFVWQLRFAAINDADGNESGDEQRSVSQSDEDKQQQQHQHDYDDDDNDNDDNDDEVEHNGDLNDDADESDESDESSRGRISTAEADEARLKQRYEHALQLQGAHEYAQARAAYEQMLTSSFLLARAATAVPGPSAANLRHPAAALRYLIERNCGMVCVHLADCAAALAHFLGALQLDASDVVVALAAADAATQISLWPVARRLLETALLTHPRNWLVLQRLGDVLFAVDEAACDALLGRMLLYDAHFPYAMHLRAHLRNAACDKRQFASALALREKHDSPPPASGARTIEERLRETETLSLPSPTWLELAKALLIAHTKRVTSTGQLYGRAVAFQLPTADETQAIGGGGDVAATAAPADNTASPSPRKRKLVAENAAAAPDAANGGADSPLLSAYVPAQLFADEANAAPRRSRRHGSRAAARSANPVDVVLSFVSTDAVDAGTALDRAEPTAMRVDSVVYPAADESPSVATLAQRRAAERRDVVAFVESLGSATPLHDVMRRFVACAVAGSATVVDAQTHDSHASLAFAWHEQAFRSLFLAIYNAVVESSPPDRFDLSADLTVLELVHEAVMQPSMLALAASLVKDTSGLALPSALSVQSPAFATPGRGRRQAKQQRHAAATAGRSAVELNQRLVTLLHRVIAQCGSEEPTAAVLSDDAVDGTSGDDVDVRRSLARLRLHWFLSRVCCLSASAADAVAHLDSCKTLLGALRADVVVHTASAQWRRVCLASTDQWLLHAQAQLRSIRAEAAVASGDFGAVVQAMLPMLADHKLPLAPLSGIVAGAPFAPAEDAVFDAHVADFRMLRALHSASLARVELATALRCSAVLLGALCRQHKLQTSTQTIELLGVVQDCIVHPLARALLASERADLQRLLSYAVQVWRASWARRLTKLEKFAHRAMTVIVSSVLLIGTRGADAPLSVSDEAQLLLAVHDLLGKQKWCTQFRGSFLELLLARLCRPEVVQPPRPSSAARPLDDEEVAEVADAAAPASGALRAAAAAAEESDDGSADDAPATLPMDEELTGHGLSLDRDDTQGGDELSEQGDAGDVAEGADAAPEPEHELVDRCVTQSLFCHYGLKLRADVVETHVGERVVYPLVSRIEILRAAWFVWRFGYLDELASAANAASLLRIVAAIGAYAMEPPARLARYRGAVQSVFDGSLTAPSDAGDSGVVAAAPTTSSCFSGQELESLDIAEARGVVGRRCHILWPDDHAWYRGVAIAVRKFVADDAQAAAKCAPAAVQVLIKYDDDGISHWEDANGYLVIAEEPSTSYGEFDALFVDGFVAVARYVRRFHRSHLALAAQLLERALLCAPKRADIWLQLGLVCCARSRAMWRAPPFDGSDLDAAALEERAAQTRLARTCLVHARDLCSQEAEPPRELLAAVHMALGSLVCDELVTTPSVKVDLPSLGGSLVLEGPADDDDDGSAAATRHFPPPLPGSRLVRVDVEEGVDADAIALAELRHDGSVRQRSLESCLALYGEAQRLHPTWQALYMVAKQSEKLAFLRVTLSALHESKALIPPPELVNKLCEQRAALADCLDLYSQCSQALPRAAAATAAAAAAPALAAGKMASYLAAELQYRKHTLRLRAYEYVGQLLVDAASDVAQKDLLRFILSSSFFAQSGFVVAEEGSRTTLAVARLARMPVDTGALNELLATLEQHATQQLPNETSLLLRYALGVRDCLAAFAACRTCTWFRKANYRIAMLLGFGLAPLADELELPEWANELRLVASKSSRTRMLFVKTRSVDGVMSNWANAPGVVDRSNKRFRDLRRFLVLDARLAALVPTFALRLDDLYTSLKDEPLVADFVEPLRLNFWCGREAQLLQEIAALRKVLIEERQQSARAALASGHERPFVPVTRDVALAMQRVAPVGLGDQPANALLEAWRIYSDAIGQVNEWRRAGDAHRARADRYGTVVRRCLLLVHDIYDLSLATPSDKQLDRVALRLRPNSARELASTLQDAASDDTEAMRRVIDVCAVVQKGGLRKRAKLFAHLGVVAPTQQQQ
jgi:hypothetical protein